jgi:hypothetical protein
LVGVGRILTTGVEEAFLALAGVADAFDVVLGAANKSM